MDRESILRHVYGTAPHRVANLDRRAALLPSPARRKPMQNPVTTNWDLDISDTDFTQLKLGFAGTNQDHKWTIAANDADERGPATDRIGAKVESITWNAPSGTASNSADLEQTAKDEAILLCRIHAGCAFESLPKIEASIFWDPRPDNKGSEVGESTSS
ncbi:hypothetical protein MCOR25_010674 [Pyricularia grisea]|nr:hypothetical protein MCOR25_010674 [Pyricularia grisea]